MPKMRFTFPPNSGGGLSNQNLALLGHDWGNKDHNTALIISQLRAKYLINDLMDVLFPDVGSIELQSFIDRDSDMLGRESPESVAVLIPVIYSYLYLKEAFSEIANVETATMVLGVPESESEVRYSDLDFPVQGDSYLDGSSFNTVAAYREYLYLTVSLAEIINYYKVQTSADAISRQINLMTRVDPIEMYARHLNLCFSWVDAALQTITSEMANLSTIPTKDARSDFIDTKAFFDRINYFTPVFESAQKVIAGLLNSDPYFETEKEYREYIKFQYAEHENHLKDLYAPYIGDKASFNNLNDYPVHLILMSNFLVGLNYLKLENGDYFTGDLT